MAAFNLINLSGLLLSLQGHPHGALLALAPLLVLPARRHLARQAADHLGFFQFVHDARRRGKALLGAFVTVLVA